MKEAPAHRGPGQRSGLKATRDHLNSVLPYNTEETESHRGNLIHPGSPELAGPQGHASLCVALQVLVQGH